MFCVMKNNTDLFPCNKSRAWLAISSERFNLLILTTNSGNIIQAWNTEENIVCEMWMWNWTFNFKVKQNKLILNIHHANDYNICTEMHILHPDY